MLDAALSDFFGAAHRYGPAGPGKPAPPVRAVAITVGSGKSFAARLHASRFLGRLRDEGDPRRVALAVPTHALGDEQALLFGQLPESVVRGLAARVYKGREADDPDRPGAKMCLERDAVELARGVLASVPDTVCGVPGGPLCPRHGECGYQRQLREATEAPPDLWVVPHQRLFLASEGLGPFAAIIVDEAFWQAGLRRHPEFPLDALELDVVPGSPLGALRHRLMGLLRTLPDGPVPRAGLAAAFSEGVAGQAITMEWQRKAAVAMYPGMPVAGREDAYRAASANRRILAFGAAWRAVQALVAPDGPDRSGWLALGRGKEGERLVRVQGRESVRAAWQVPTLIMDAVLDVELVLPFYPQAVVAADITVEAPHQRIVQVGDDEYPLSMFKNDSDRERDLLTARNHLGAVRHVLWREARHSHPQTVLAVTQKRVGTLLRRFALPLNLELAHYRALAGRDSWKDVRTIVLVGRTLPRPGEVEELASRLSGRAVATLRASAADGPGQGSWYAYGRTRDRMVAGKWVEAVGPLHPDPLAESVRRQIAEAEHVQAIGRGRGVSRDAGSPLDVLVLCSLPLRLPVSQLIRKKQLAATPVEEMLREGGVALANGTHASLAYPSLWRTTEAAKQAIRRAKLASDCERSATNAYLKPYVGFCHHPLLAYAYQLEGAGQRPAEALFDPLSVDDPRSWLASRLGPLRPEKAPPRPFPAAPWP